MRARISDAWLSCDHTFKSVLNIGLVRESDKRWVKQYSGLFFVLNEIGEVMTWKMTRSLTFDHIAESLHTLKQRLGKVLRIIIIVTSGLVVSAAMATFYLKSPTIIRQIRQFQQLTQSGLFLITKEKRTYEISVGRCMISSLIFQV